MIKFLKNIVVFLLITVIIGEIVVRVTHAVTDIPQRTIDDSGIQKYFPNQDGYWKGGDHQWVVNELGWPGELPDSNDNLINIIGDSYIENFMNPNECHQSTFLKENMKDYNFMEAARSGVSLIEAMEISKQTDTLNPKHTLIYVNNNDFLESIVEVKSLSDITQVNLTNNEIVFGKMKAPGAKKVLYTWKLLYYFYNRFPIGGNKKKKKKDALETTSKKDAERKTEHDDNILKLINYIKANYTISNKTLVFHPNSDHMIIDMCLNSGFNVIVLDSSNDSKDWTFGYDTHWTCYGHEKVAEQVSKNLLSNKSISLSN
ncbi:hypothetical protein [Winogradskyella sp.]|uniref:hypothetical protein n=1 Tax=Winogradskyella sp. TaxID=1883156 RepID=UPI0025D351BB|nr:hypothetical protein [Winogradskyella sp.]